MRMMPVALGLLLLAGCDAKPPAVQQDVRDFLQRRTDCNHWAGEEGYDAARRAEINAAYAKLRCAAPSPYALSMTDATGHIRKFEEMESEIIETAIARYEGHMSEVARRLGIGRSTLYRKLKEFGLEPELENEPMAKVAEDTAEPMGDMRKTA